jgi:hypothetical protein
MQLNGAGNLSTLLPAIPVDKLRWLPFPDPFNPGTVSTVGRHVINVEFASLRHEV